MPFGIVIHAEDRFLQRREAAESKLDFCARFLGHIPDADLTPPVLSFPSPGTVVTTTTTSNWRTLNPDEDDLIACRKRSHTSD